MKRKKPGIIRLQLLAVIMASFSAQQTAATMNLKLDGNVYAATIPAQSLCALIFEK